MTNTEKSVKEIVGEIYRDGIAENMSRQDIRINELLALLQKEREAGKREAYQNCVDWTKQVQPYNQEAINAHSAAVSQMDWELKSQSVEKSNSLQEKLEIDNFKFDKKGNSIP